jgi:hypothetical protein
MSQTKSEAIREALQKNPKAKPAAIVEDLSKKGVKVSASLVSAVKHSGKKAKRKTKRPQAAKHSFLIGQIQAAIDYRKQFKSSQAARDFLDVADQLLR